MEPIKSTHFAIQLSSAIWLVTFVSEIGITETRTMSSAEFIAMITAEARLG